MQVDKVRALKTKTEKEIRNLLFQLEEKTGMDADVRVSKECIVDLYDIKVEIKLTMQ